MKLKKSYYKRKKQQHKTVHEHTMVTKQSTYSISVFFLQAVTQDTGQVAGSSDNNNKKPTEKHFRL